MENERGDLVDLYVCFYGFLLFDLVRFGSVLSFDLFRLFLFPLPPVLIGRYSQTDTSYRPKPPFLSIILSRLQPSSQFPPTMHQKTNISLTETLYL